MACGSPLPSNLGPKGSERRLESQRHAPQDPVPVVRGIEPPARRLLAHSGSSQVRIGALRERMEVVLLRTELPGSPLLGLLGLLEASAPAHEQCEARSRLHL